MRRLASDKLVIASHNAGKLREFAAFLTPLGITAVSAGDLGLPEPAETETTFAGNARIKAHAAAQATGLPALSDDSGITIDGLDGAPGVYTADWAEGPGGRDYMKAMTRAWQELLDRGAPQPWTAAFNATLCLAWPDGHDEIFEGRISGHLQWPPKGDFGFGFDPIFVPDGYSQSFGEMDPEVKHRISHRAAAVAQLLAGSLAR